jgi:hypothetical protein
MLSMKSKRVENGKARVLKLPFEAIIQDIAARKTRLPHWLSEIAE